MEWLQRELREWLSAFALAVVIAVMLHVFVIDNYIVDGASMLPTLHDQERVIVYKLGQRLGDTPNRGDIIVFAYAREPWRDFVKRVIGVEGDVIEIKEGKVYVNDTVLAENYLSAATLGNYGPVTVSTDTVFVLGDNRNFSMDSRDSSVGLVPIESIKGKAIVVYWPLDAFRLVKR